MNIEKAYFQPGPDGVIRVGNDVILLKDESAKTYETDNMKGFEAFLEGREQDNEIYYSADKLYLVPTKASKQSHALAICSLEAGALLKEILKNANRDLTIEALEMFLTALRKFSDSNILSLISKLRNFSVAKKQTYERQVDNEGNFKMLIQREGAETGNWIPPSSLHFSVPCFKYLDEEVSLEFTFIFSMNSVGTPMFKLQNLNVDEEVQEQRKQIIESRLDGTSCPKYWGTSKLHGQDDSWKYQSNGISE